MAGPDKLRRQHLAARIRQLGPRPLLELIEEVLAAVSSSYHGAIDEIIETYARLNPDLVKAIGGDRFPPGPLHIVRRRP